MIAVSMPFGVLRKVANPHRLKRTISLARKTRLENLHFSEIENPYVSLGQMVLAKHFDFVSSCVEALQMHR
jgi:hypothetical protein